MKNKVQYDKARYQLIKQGLWKFNSIPPTIFTSEQEQVLTGSLLGDAHLYKYKNQINAGLAIGRSSKDKEYLEYQYLIFKDFCSKPIQDRFSFDKRTNKIYSNSSFRSQVAESLTLLKNKWYLDGEKIVPKDIVLTPLTCAIWFCDDGSITGAGNKRRISLYTDSFNKDDVYFLKESLSKTINIEFSITRKKSMLNINKGFYLYIDSKHNVCKFISYIKDSFPISMKRKSDRWKGYYDALV